MTPTPQERTELQRLAEAVLAAHAEATSLPFSWLDDHISMERAQRILSEMFDPEEIAYIAAANPAAILALLSAAQDAARHLRLIAKDVRSAGDVELVQLDETGVGPAPAHATLADELELIAIGLVGLK